MLHTHFYPDRIYKYTQVAYKYSYRCSAHLGDVVIAVLAAYGLDGADVQAAKNLGTGVDPQFIPAVDANVRRHSVRGWCDSVRHN